MNLRNISVGQTNKRMTSASASNKLRSRENDSNSVAEYIGGTVSSATSNELCDSFCS